MTQTSISNIWQLMAAFASDDYELREVAPGEFELIASANDADDAHAPETVADHDAALCGSADVERTEA